MVRFYWRLVCAIPKGARDSLSSVDGWIGLAAFAILLFNKPIGAKLMNWWEGVNPAWALVPVGLLFAHRLLWTAYQMGLDDRGKNGADRKLLQALYDRGMGLMNTWEISHPAGPEAWRREISAWANDTEQCLRDLYGCEVAGRFRTMEPPPSEEKQKDDEVARRERLLIARLAYLSKLNTQ